MSAKGGAVGKIVVEVVEKGFEKADNVVAKAARRADRGLPDTPGSSRSARAPHQNYDGTTRPGLTPDGKNLTPPSSPASRPGLGDRLPPDSPHVKAQTKLNNILTNLYKGTTNPRGTVGDGRTADAHRWEDLSGQSLGRNPRGEPATHQIKATESERGLRNWLRDNPGAPQEWRDIAAAEADNLANALKGY